MTDTDRGLSDLVGFVIIFGIVLFAASVTVTIGQNQLDQLQENEQIRNAERGMELLGQQFDRIEAGQATVRTGQLQLAGGSFETANRTTIEIVVRNDTTGWTYGPERVSAKGIRYRFEDQIVAYEAGGLFRRTAGVQSPGVATVRPEFACSDSRAFVSVVTLNGSFSLDGGTATVRSVVADASLLYPTNRTGSVGTSGSVDNVTVSFPGLSGSEHGWTYLAESAGWNRTGTNTYTCDTESVFVRHTVINVSASN